MTSIDLAIDVYLGINGLVVPNGKPRGRVTVLLLCQLMRVRAAGPRRGRRQIQMRISRLKRIRNAHFVSVPQSGKSWTRGWEVGRGLITSGISRTITGHTSGATNIRFDWCSTAKAFIFFCKNKNANVQGDPNQNPLFQMAVPLKLCISNPMLVKPNMFER